MLYDTVLPTLYQSASKKQLLGILNNTYHCISRCETQQKSLYVYLNSPSNSPKNHCKSPWKPPQSPGFPRPKLGWPGVPKSPINSAPRVNNEIFQRRVKPGFMGSMESKSPWLVWWLDGCRMVFVAKKMDDLLMLRILSVWFLWV